MNWIDIILISAGILGFAAMGAFLVIRLYRNPLLLIDWWRGFWPVLKPIVIKFVLWILASSPETQARAREDSRQHNEPGKGHGPER